MWWLNQDTSLFLTPVTAQVGWTQSAGSSPLLGLSGTQAALLSSTRDFPTCCLSSWGAGPEMISEADCTHQCCSHSNGETLLLRPHLVAGKTESFSPRWAATSQLQLFSLEKGFQWKLVGFHHSPLSRVWRNSEQAICSFYFKVNGVLNVVNVLSLSWSLFFHYEHDFFLAIRKRLTLIKISHWNYRKIISLANFLDAWFSSSGRNI